MSVFFNYLSLLWHVSVLWEVCEYYLSYPMLQSHIVSDYVLKKNKATWEQRRVAYI